MAEPFTLQYSEKAIADIERLRKFDQRQVVGGIVSHLTHEPTRISRSRIKLMEQPFWSEYRLRVGEFRVYYDVDAPAHTVNVLRVIEKGTQVTAERSP